MHILRGHQRLDNKATQNGKTSLNTYILIIVPFLVATHAVASHKINWTVSIRCIETIIVWHDLLTLGVSEDLIST